MPLGLLLVHVLHVGASSAEQDVQRLYLDARGECPSQSVVAEELTPLLERWELTDSETDADAVVQVVDRGSTLSVSVLGDVREVSDEGRDCQGRARVAAVFAALRLEPADFPQDEEVGGAPAQTPPSPAAQQPAQPAPVFAELSVGALAEKSVDRSLNASVGPAVSLTLGRGATLLHASASLQSRSRTEAEGVALSLTRIPMDLGVGVSVDRGPFRIQPILSLALDHLRVLAPDLEDARTRGRLMLGPRISLRSSWGLGRLRPFAMVRGSWFPRDYIVDVEPLGEVRRTPRFWLGLALGLELDLRKLD